MKRVLCFLFSVFLGWTAYAAQAVNVEYIHDLILQKWNISVPYNSALNNTQAVANMKYLLTSVDVANAMLNGGAITDWGNGTYATNQVADTVAANQVIANLIKLPVGEYPFEIKTTKDTTYFSFSMSAKGSFVVNWGDGNIEVITNPDTSTVTYDHTYDVAKNYTIGIKGTATAYSNGSSTPVISFDGNENISMIFGSVGQVFPTLANGTNPKFYYTFANLPNISGGIPSTLFSGITGVPAKNMFYGTFYGSAGLTGGIPGALFSGLDGAPTEGIFYRTFEKCTGLSGPIPSDLFAGIHGTPARDMFHSTFSGCKGLTAIPDGLFAGINGAPAQRMYNATFYECSGITSNIPDKLFGTFNGAPQELMFGNTFHGCTNLTGTIPVDLFAGITGAPIQRMFEGTFSMCSGLTGQIPANLFSSMGGAPAASMFYNTFTGCSGLTGTVPAGLFATFSGAPAQRMFNKTFYNCNQLTGIDSGVFGELSGDAQAGMFEEMFNRATALRGPSAKIGSKYLYEIWPDATSSQVGKMYSGAAGLSDYEYIPIVWGGLGQQRPDYKLYLDHYYQRVGSNGDVRDSDYLLMISAAGKYNIDWGDGTEEVIEKNTVGEQWFGHDYANDGEYLVRIGGQATEYSSDPDLSTVILGSSIACIDEWNRPDGKCPLALTHIDGCLGCVFPTLENGSQPRFIDTFADAMDFYNIPAGLFSDINGAPVKNMFKRTFSFTSLSTVPAGLFAGIQGAPAEYMFSSTFAGTYLESIPEGLFAGIKGPPAKGMFQGTFTEAAIESIPEGLFAGIKGPPAEDMFNATFSANWGLESIPEDLFAGIQGPPAAGMFAGTFNFAPITSLPSGLFAGIQGPPAEDMFNSTFANNWGLESIPENLFAGIDTTAPSARYMFAETFRDCFNLTGPSARINGRYLYNIWPDGYDMYSGCEGLTDYNCIPSAWGGGGKNCLWTDPA